MAERSVQILDVGNVLDSEQREDLIVRLQSTPSRDAVTVSVMSVNSDLTGIQVTNYNRKREGRGAVRATSSDTP